MGWNSDEVIAKGNFTQLERGPSLVRVQQVADHNSLCGYRIWAGRIVFELDCVGQ